MSSERKHERMDPENMKEMLSIVSSEIPAMIKNILSSVFSEEAGKNMGKAAAAYYKELRDGGLPEPVAVKMTEEYMRTFTNIGEMLKGVGGGRGRWGASQADEISKHISERIQSEAMQKRSKEEEEE